MTTTIHPGTAEWLEARRLHLCASDAPAVLGLSNEKFSTVYDVCLAKWGEAPEQEMTEQMQRGIALQDPIAHAYELKTNTRLLPEAFIVHPDYSWMAATPDGSVVGGDKNVQIKTHVHWLADDYGATGTDEIPDWEFVQVSHEMAVAGLNTSDLVVLFSSEETFSLLRHMVENYWRDANGGRDIISRYILDNMDLRIFTVERNADIEKDMIDAEHDFWHNYVLPHELPPSAPVRQNSDRIRLADLKETAAIEGLHKIYITQERIKVEWAKHKQYLTTLIGEDSGISAPDAGKVTYKKAKDSVSTITEWEQIATSLWSNFAKEHGMNEEAFKKIIEAHTVEVVKPGSRRFVYPWKRWKKEV